MDITLALGGGGVRGVAHIGVLRALEEHGFKVKAIAGTSAGGLVGAVYAAGNSTQAIKESFIKLREKWDFSRKSDARPSLLGLSSITKTLSEFLGDLTFDELKIPFAATAVSLQTGKEIILRKGKVIDAVLATIAIPGVFPSQKIDDRVLVDGGVMDPVPIRLARWLRPDLPVVAVVLHNQPDDGQDFQEDLLSLPLPIPAPSAIIERFMKLRAVQAFNIFTRSLDMSGKQLSELAIKLYQPEVVITPLVGQIGVLQKVDPDELIQIGMDATQEILQELKSHSNWMKRIQRKVKYQVFSDPPPSYWENISS